MLFYLTIAAYHRCDGMADQYWPIDSKNVEGDRLNSKLSYSESKFFNYNSKIYTNTITQSLIIWIHKSLSILRWSWKMGPMETKSGSNSHARWNHVRGRFVTWVSSASDVMIGFLFVYNYFNEFYIRETSRSFKLRFSEFSRSIISKKISKYAEHAFQHGDAIWPSPILI